MRERKAYMQDKFWLRLDNAAKIYPAIRTRELTSVFRLSVVLKESVQGKQLLEAVHALGNRFPYYKVRLKKGFFWYYLAHFETLITVEPDAGVPCRSFGKKDLMFRILARGNTISVEFSHILTDASGAFEFLKSLLLVYFSNCGISIPPGLSFIRPGETPAEEEYEDAYSRFFRKTVSPKMHLRAAFHLPFPLKKPADLNVMLLEMPADKIINRAKTYGVSLTEYLTAIYLFALQEIFEAQPPLKKRISNKIFRIEVPVNLRRIYPTISMRNFSLYVLPEIDLRLGHYTFEEIVKTVYHLLRLETDEKLINKVLSRNVGGERNPFVKPIPLFIKSFLFSTFYSLGTSRYSGVVTNLGRIELPPEISRYIDHFIFIPPPPSKKLKVNCGVVGFDNKLVLGFSNITVTDAVEQQFLNFLNKEGIPVNIRKYDGQEIHQREAETSVSPSRLKKDGVPRAQFSLQSMSRMFKRIFHT
jgi:NRPS condensation-like uncharacterized protein